MSPFGDSAVVGGGVIPLDFAFACLWTGSADRSWPYCFANGLYLTAFVSPTTGEVFWYASTGVPKPSSKRGSHLAAEEAGAGRERIIIGHRAPR
jgi:hypothetical protein